MWKIVGSFQKDASVQKLKLFDASSGHKFTKKKKYRVLNERVQKIMSVYEDKTNCTLSERCLVCVKTLKVLSHFLLFFRIIKIQILILLKLWSAFFF